MSGKTLKAIAGSELTILKLGSLEVPCYVLENEARVISGRGMQKILGFSSTSSGAALTNLVNSRLKCFLSEEAINALENPFEFDRIGRGGSVPVTYGYDAAALIDICDALIQAKRYSKLTELQNKHASYAEDIIRSAAKVGIIALIDEATGYQDVRSKRALATILETFIDKELQPWIKTFPYEFYKQIFRLRNWPGPDGTKRPSVIGRYTNDFIYSRLAHGVLDELKRINPACPKGGRKNRHHQWFTPDIGHPKLKEHLAAVIALMRASSNWSIFQRNLKTAFPQKNENMELPLED